MLYLQVHRLIRTHTCRYTYKSICKCTCNLQIITSVLISALASVQDSVPVNVLASVLTSVLMHVLVSVFVSATTCILVRLQQPSGVFFWGGYTSRFACNNCRAPPEVLLDPCRTWCPSSNCQAVCQLKESDSPALPQLVQCAVCALEFCSACKANWHPGQACQESNLPITSFLPGENRYGPDSGSASQEDESDKCGLGDSAQKGQDLASNIELMKRE